MCRACVMHGATRNAYNIVVTGVRKRMVLTIVLQSVECKDVIQQSLVVGLCEQDNEASCSMNSGECFV